MSLTAGLTAPTADSAVPASLENGPIAIGARTIRTRYFLAPLAGYTHLAFRRVLRELGGLGLATTDLVHATMLVSGKRKSLELIETHPADTPLSVQIYSGVREHVVTAAKWLEDRGYQGVDINMGCPMAKVTGSGGGARLMCDPDGACRLVADTVAAVKIPVTVKMRLGWDRSTITAPALAREFEAAGVAAITIHGRTRSQGFRGTVDLDGIRDVVAAVDAIPVIGNGDVVTVADAIRMREYTGCDAVAIGRGALLDPWMFRRLSAWHEGADAEFTPTPEDQIRFLRRHLELMWEQHGEYSCLMFRKFAAWYGARLGIPEDLEDRLRRFTSREEFDGIAAEVAERHGQRETSTATALIRVPNGPVEHW